MPAGLYDSRFLNSARIQRIIEIAGSYLERMRPLQFLDRLQLVNAQDDELMGRFTARQFAADIVADDQAALVYDAGQIELVTTALPNVKHGAKLGQAQLNALNRLSEIPRAQEEDAWADWEQRMVQNLLQGVRERMNAMACAMMIDRYDYDRWGVKLANATWGMPANLKVTVSPAWSLDGGATSNAAATPISDIFAMDVIDEANYGLGPFDRVTMATTTFYAMCGTTEFMNKANLFSGINFALASGYLSLNNREAMLTLAGKVLGKEIVLDDKRIREQFNDGSMKTTRVLPANKVLLDRKSNSTTEWDFGNGVVTESLVASLLSGNGLVLGENPALGSGGSYGPLGYYTAQDAQLNPPGIIAFAVNRCFPRKHVIEASAVLTVW